METYRIFALRYAGPFVRTEAFLLWLGDCDKTEEIYYYLWLIRGGGEDIVVDAGVGPELAAEKDLRGYVSPARVLAGIGVDATRVKHVILTHLHWDHMDGSPLFPRATFYVQRREFDFWQKDPALDNPALAALAARPALRYLADLEGTERLVLLEGEEEILPGVRCLPAPGHTPALQAVAVETEKGRAVLGSDCGHVFRNYRESRPSCLICDLPGWLRSFESLKERVSSPELLFPGHDKRMSAAYPREAEGVWRLA